jgi:hypothetical protein
MSPTANTRNVLVVSFGNAKHQKQHTRQIYKMTAFYEEEEMEASQQTAIFIDVFMCKMLTES